MEPISVIIIGAGSRGMGYASRMNKLQDKFRVVEYKGRPCEYSERCRLYGGTGIL